MIFAPHPSASFAYRQNCMVNARPRLTKKTDRPSGTRCLVLIKALVLVLSDPWRSRAVAAQLNAERPPLAAALRMYATKSADQAAAIADERLFLFAARLAKKPKPAKAASIIVQLEGSGVVAGGVPRSISASSPLTVLVLPLCWS